MARALRLAIRPGAPSLGDDGVFRIEVPGGPCQQACCGAASGGEGGSSASRPGHRVALRCGGVAMDLVSACEAAENPIPVGIAARQWTTWVQTHQSDGDLQRIQLTSCTGAMTWKAFFTTPGSFGPVLIAMVIWVLACFLYALYGAPEIPMVTPELFYQQVQEQISNIPVPKHSPHYSHYRQYYLQQYQQHLSQYRELEVDWKNNKGHRLHWGALLQGLGLGTWLFVAILAFCEYQYSTITTWMEMIEEWWADWRRRSSSDEKARSEGVRKAVTTGHGKAAETSKAAAVDAAAAAVDAVADMIGSDKQKPGARGPAEKVGKETDKAHEREKEGTREKLQQKLSERQRKKKREEVAAAVERAQLERREVEERRHPSSPQAAREVMGPSRKSRTPSLPPFSLFGLGAEAKTPRTRTLSTKKSQSPLERPTRS